MKDIQTIGSDFQRNSFNVLPGPFDRLRSCLYFCEEIQKHATSENDKLSKWYLGAALSSFQTTLETVGSEVKVILGANLWKESEQKQLMENDTLVKILTKLRNYTVHSTRLSGVPKKYSVTQIDGEGSRVIEIRSLFFDHLNKSKNIRGISRVSTEEIQWFNKQTETWPADLLLREGLYQASAYVHHFCAINKIA